MAGDWIKMRADLLSDPAVKGIARRTGLDRFAVVGRLHTVWSWADKQLRDGNAVGVTPEDIDEEAGHPGFAQAMSDERWLKILSTGVSFPNFDRHNGKPAKERALTTKRVQRHRNGADLVSPLPEKRREELINNSTVPIGTGAPIERDPTDLGLPPERQNRPPPRSKPKPQAERTQEVLADQRKAAGNTAPMPEHLRKFMSQTPALAKFNEHHADPTDPRPPREPGADEDEFDAIPAPPQPAPSTPPQHDDDFGP